MQFFPPAFSNQENYLLAMEWLVTNGIGGYAAGTVANVLTRSYHGLLVSALTPPLGRTVQLVKLDEIVFSDGEPFPLFDNRWEGDDSPLEPGGHALLEDFHLEHGMPVWRFAVHDRVIVKRIWMQPGANTTYVRYDFIGGGEPVDLRLKVILNSRDFHGVVSGDRRNFEIKEMPNGLAVHPPDGKPFYLLSGEGLAEPAHLWYRAYYHAAEAYRGLASVGDNLFAGYFHARLAPGTSVHLVASTNPKPELDGGLAYEAFFHRQSETLRLTRTPAQDRRLAQLVLAADQFIVRRNGGHTVIAGYPWFGDWGRDTMIALPGLTLPTGKPGVARSILETFARFIDRGMLPNRFPDEGENPEYNTVDATLWYFEAIRAYAEETGDLDLVARLFPALEDIIEWHVRGTRYNIRADPRDGLLFAGREGVQLTWMDAKVDGWVVTPRIGKPVEVNALWYNALRIMEEFARQLGKSDARYSALAGQVLKAFDRFWNAERKSLFDVLDTPAGGPDPAVRPNQIFAVSLPHSPLEADRQRAVVDACMNFLVTPRGLRSLSKDHPEYAGHYGGSRRGRDGAYHQGTVWGWLIGPFVMAHYRVWQDAPAARDFLLPVLENLAEHGVGTMSEIFDGDAPHAPRGCIAQAWTVAEVLRCWDFLEKEENRR